MLTKRDKEVVIDLYINDYTLTIENKDGSFVQINRIYTKVYDVLKLLSSAINFKVDAKL